MTLFVKTAARHPRPTRSSRGPTDLSPSHHHNDGNNDDEDEEGYKDDEHDEGYVSYEDENDGDDGST